MGTCAIYRTLQERSEKIGFYRSIGLLDTLLQDTEPTLCLKQVVPKHSLFEATSAPCNAFHLNHCQILVPMWESSFANGLFIEKTVETSTHNPSPSSLQFLLYYSSPCMSLSLAFWLPCTDGGWNSLQQKEWYSFTGFSF